MGNTDKKQPSEFQVTAYRCRCGHEWVPRNKGERPRVCPKCKSPNWDKPKQIKIKMF
jgi:predicted Zn-ribbon and HTH transcriptional regulator